MCWNKSYRDLFIIERGDPPGCAYWAAREYRPVKRTIFYDRDYVRYHPNWRYDDLPDPGTPITSPIAYFIQLPYMIFVSNPANLNVMFSDKPLKTFRDKVYHPSLPNIFDFVACLGTDRPSNLAESIELFWSNNFNNEMGHMSGNLGPLLLNNFKGFKAWESYDIHEVMKRTQELPSSPFIDTFTRMDYQYTGFASDLNFCKFNVLGPIE
jgi:hypothetical protein